jgi:hypothetical protein
MSMFAGLLTSYTTRHNIISSSLACLCSQVYLHATPPDTTRLAAASHVHVRKPTYFLQLFSSVLLPKQTLDFSPAMPLLLAEFSVCLLVTHT